MVKECCMQPIVLNGTYNERFIDEMELNDYEQLQTHVEQLYV